jgi:glycosyltransferase involved in cell wall biosynthesis
LKIVHLLNGARTGAAEQQFERLIGALQAQGIAQHVLMTTDAPRAERLRTLGITTREITFPTRFAFMDRRTINGEIRKQAPEVVMSWSAKLGAFMEQGDHVHLGRMDRTFDGSLMASCDHLVAPSQARADKAIAAGWSNERVHVVPPLVGPEAVAVAGRASDRKLDRKMYYTPSTTKLVFCAAELDENSGVDVLLKAIARLSGFYLWIAGDGPARAALEEQAHELGIKPRVRFLGWQDDLKPMLAVADMMVCPGPQDDTGDMVMEGWSAGTPVIAADSLGPGLLIKQRENGVLVPVGDAINLAEAIKWLSREPATAQKLGEEGAKAFGDNWVMNKILPQYVSLFDRLISKPSTGP